MKKLMLVMISIATMAFASCSKETTYTFFNNYDYTADVMIMEYNEAGKPVASSSGDNILPGAKKTFVASDMTSYVTARIEVKIGSSTLTKWIQQVYYLEHGKDVVIELNGNTIIGNYEP